MIKTRYMSIYIEGAQNTGKTTLIKNVKNRFPSICIMNEIARTVIKKKIFHMKI